MTVAPPIVTSLTPIEIQTRDQAEAAMALVTSITLQRQAVQGQQNTELLLARNRDKEIQRLGERLERYENALKSWAQKNRSEFGGSKTLKMRQGKISFRALPRSLDFLTGWTQDQVLAKLRKIKKWGIYIRTKESLDLQLILSDSKPEVARLKEKELAKMGLQISTGESVSVQPNLETLPT